MRVAPTADASFSHDDPLAIMGQVSDQLACHFVILGILPHDRTDRNPENKVLTARAVHLRTLSVGASLRLEMMLEPVIDERG